MLSTVEGCRGTVPINISFWELNWDVSGKLRIMIDQITLFEHSAANNSVIL